MGCKSGYSDEKWALAEAYFQAGRSVTFISKEVGISRAYLYAQTKKRGWVRQPLGAKREQYERELQKVLRKMKEVQNDLDDGQALDHLRDVIETQGMIGDIVLDGVVDKSTAEAMIANEKHKFMLCKLSNVLDQMVSSTEMLNKAKGGPIAGLRDAIAGFDKLIRADRIVLGLDKGAVQRTPRVIIVPVKISEDDWEAAAKRIIQGGEKDVIQADYEVIEDEDQGDED